MRRLIINLDKCGSCPECVVGCSYYYHPGNRGIDRLRELAVYALVCRHCEHGTCVRACPVEALERDKDGVVQRYSMRCIGCRSCSHACPFGTIYLDLLPYKLSGCDLCADRAEEDPVCVRTCPYNALEYREVEEDPGKGIYLLDDKLAVISRHWKR